MIANLMTTLIMALGVATGNVSSNSYKSGNAFNNKENIEAIEIKEPQNKKAVTNIDITEHYDWITEINANNGTYKKYYMQEGNYTPNYQNNYFLIRNTTYTFNTSYQAENWQLLSINNNYDDVINTRIINKYAVNIMGNPNLTTNITASKKMYLTNDKSILNYIDLTLTASLKTTLDNLINDLENEVIEANEIFNETTTETITNNQGSIHSITNDTGETQIAARSTLNIILYNKVESTPLTIDNLRPDTIKFTGNVLVPEINYEIVDVPNLMFTILTLPFTFYSTAFNLTIFPNTPYALNFGNIILTIIAALILMYLIKKVIK